MSEGYSAQHDDFITAEQPWPGLVAFTESAHIFFHGRAKATEDVVRLVSTSHASVLFGQSGLGKTSLILAGLFPQLRQDDCLPIYVRLDHAEAAQSLSAQILSALVKECRRIHVDCPQPRPEDTLWAYFHRQDADFWANGIQLLTPVLVLDQFEELFTQGRQSALSNARVATFIDDLAGLVENRAPQSIRQQIEVDPARARDYDFARANFRLMVSLREDFLPELEGLMPQLPTLRLNRMRLLPMNGNEALQVVEQGGGSLVEPRVGEHIVRFVAADTKARPLADLAVEPSLLSLICRELNLRRQSKTMSKITTDLLTGARDEILGEFYQRCLEDQVPEVSEFIEDHLLSESGYRNSMALDDALCLPEIVRPVIDALVQRRLLRQEERSGLLRVELAHDVLTQVARQRRSQRREEKARKEARLQLEKARQRLRSMGTVAAVMLLVIIAMGLVSWKMFKAQHELAASLATSDFRMGAQLALERKPREALAYLARAMRTNGDANSAALSASLLAYEMQNPLASLRHEDIVQSAKFSPDGRWLVTASSDKTARVWDASTGLPVSAPMQHEDVVYSAVFSPDGHRVATASWDKTARVWDAATGLPVSAPMRHEYSLGTAEFSPDGLRVVTASSDKTARVWDASTGLPISVPLRHESPVHTAVFSPDGRWVATASEDKTARVWDAATGFPVSAPMWHKDIVALAIFSPDGRWVATASKDKTARVWDAATGQPVSAPMQHKQTVYSAKFSPDGRWLATASEDKTAQVWEATTGLPLSAPMLHKSGLYSAEFSPDGRWLATASDDKTARVWDAVTGLPVTESMRHEDIVHSATFSPDGRRVVTTSEDKTARLWDVATGLPHSLAIRHEDGVSSAAFSPDGRWIATAWNKTVRVWDAVSGLPVSSPMRHEGAVNSTKFSPDGRWLVTASEDKTARVWDAATGMPVSTPIQHEGIVNSAEFSPDGRWLVTASSDKTARVWVASTGQPVSAPMQHEADVAIAVFSPDGRRLVTASKDPAVQVWEAATGLPVTSIMWQDGIVNSAAFSPDGRRLVITSDIAMLVLDASTGLRVSAPMRHEDIAGSGEFSPDGRWLVSRSNDKTVQVWDTATGLPVSALMRHEDDVYSAVFSPDGRWVATASSDKTARVWDAATGLLVSAPMRHEDKVYSARFSPDGRWLVTASKDKTARVWDLMPLTQASPDFAAVVEQISGCRLASNSGVACTAPATLLELRALVRHSSGLNTEEQRLLDWLAADPKQRTLSPHHPETAISRVERLIAEGSTVSLAEALNIWPEHPLALARLAEISTADTQTALWAKLSLSLAPDDLAVRASAGRTISLRARLGRLSLPIGELLLSEYDYNPQPVKFYNSPKALDPPGMSGTLAQALTFLRGDGVAQNFRQAIALLKKTAPHEAYAEFILARLQATGTGLPQDKVEACRRLQVLPDQGLPQMQTMLGWCLSNDKKYAEARVWTEKAAAQNYPSAISNLGYMTELGLGVEASPSQAASFCRRSAELGYGPAALSYAYMSEQGRGIAPSSEDALKWYRKAAELGELEAMLILASFYETGTYLPQSLEQAIALYRQAAAGGDSRALFKVGALIRDGKTADNHPPLYWFNLAAQQGSAAGHFAVGLLHELGKGVKKNPKEARRHYQWILDAKLPEGDALFLEAKLRMRLDKVR